MSDLQPGTNDSENRGSGSGSSDQYHHQTTSEIRQSTRAAVADFQRDRISEGSSSGSGRTATEVNGHAHDTSELDEPSKGRLAKAGMMGTMSSGTGGVAKRYLAGGSERQPVGWEGVSVPDKHRFMSPVIATERKKALKVRYHPISRSINHSLTTV